MPVVRVFALPPPEPERVTHCLDAVVVALSGALGSDPAGVWASWTDAAAMHTGRQPRAFAGHCPTVTILALPGRPRTQQQAGLAAVARAVATALDLPLEDVWVHWQELTPGLVYAGGALRG